MCTCMYVLFKFSKLFSDIQNLFVYILMYRDIYIELISLIFTKTFTF